MTELTLIKTSIAPVSDLTAVTLLPQTTETFVEAAPSTVRRYAGGRRRIISAPGVVEILSVDFNRIDRADYNALVALKGSLILFRDQHGRQLFGTFAAITGEEMRGRPDSVENVAVTIEEISYSEVV